MIVYMEDKGYVLMKFGEKLDFLIKNFNTSNSRLAKAIKVDPSLVSKWRRGNRVPAPDSPYVPLISSYFLNIHALQHQKDTLINVLRLAYPTIGDFESPQTYRALTEWLSMESTTGGSPIISLMEMPGDGINNVLAKISALVINDNEAAGITSPINQNIVIKPGEQGSYEVFKGIEGKRQAVMNFLNMVLSSFRPLELLLFSEEDIEWLVGDPEFFMNWGRALRQVLLQGHKVVITHNVNRDPNRIMSVIDQWVPLHLTGKLESYYYPKYTDKVIKNTMFIARGLAAIIAVNPEHSHNTNYTFFFTDPLVTKLAEENYLAFLLTCRRLVKTFKSSGMWEYCQEICKIEERPGFYYVLKNGPTSLTMPPKLYMKLLNNLNLSSTEIKARMDLHQKRLKYFERNLALYKYREFINVEAFETDLLLKDYVYSGIELFTGQAAKCNAVDYIEHISYIIDLLKQNENYELILYKLHEIDNLHRIFLSVKENYSVILSTCNRFGNNPIAIITNQDNIAGAFEDYFNMMIEHIPVSRRNKKRVIKKLENSIYQLENKY